MLGLIIGILLTVYTVAIVNSDKFKEGFKEGFEESYYEETDEHIDLDDYQ